MKKGFAERVAGEIRGTALRGESLAQRTSLRVGGPADWFISPEDREDLRNLLSLLREYGIPFLVLGGGCNLLVRDGGFRGCVISLRGFDRLHRENGNLVRAGAGVENSVFVRFCRGEGLAGLEFLVGIPGLLGGALAMNAGAGGGEITDFLETLETLKDGEFTERVKDRLDIGYRRLRLDPGEIILGASFRLSPDDPGKIRERMVAFIEKRRATQPVGYPSAGSFFKNPAEGPAWKFIDGAGMRGVEIGGAQVSMIHANFLVNRGGATAGDFLALAARVKESVRNRWGIELEEEVRVVGSDR